VTSEAAPESLVTPDMVERQGQWSEPRSSYPIGQSDIRRWAIATYWPEKPPAIYWDDEYARSTRWGGIIAPPDFNPFAWPVERPMMGGRPRPASGAASSSRRLRNMNGGQTDTYGAPMRPGDVVTSRSRLRDWEERDTRLGHTLFVFSENEWHNQNDELVRLRVSTAIRY
jgi:acyl dehydratase